MKAIANARTIWTEEFGNPLESNWIGAATSGCEFVTGRGLEVFTSEVTVCRRMPLYQYRYRFHPLFVWECPEKLLQISEFRFNSWFEG
jgi:hypothetical protein